MNFGGNDLKEALSGPGAAPCQHFSHNQCQRVLICPSPQFPVQDLFRCQVFRGAYNCPGTCQAGGVFMAFQELCDTKIENLGDNSFPE